METDGLNQRDIDNVRKAMWRKRRKHQPKLPISRMDALRAISEIGTRQGVKIVTPAFLRLYGLAQAFSAKEKRTVQRPSIENSIVSFMQVTHQFLN